MVTCTPEALAAAAGAAFPTHDPIVTNKNPGPGRDILEASATNLYSGVSMADLEEVYRADGMYGAQIAGIIRHIEAAQPFATEPMARALAALVKFYRTGEVADRERYDIAWVQDKDSPVDTINGVIEVHLDPRGIKGGWEGLVYYVNHEKTTRIRTLADNAQWCEDRMPWDPTYRKPNATPWSRRGRTLGEVR